MRRDIVGQDQNRVLATADEIPCDGEDKVRVGLKHIGHKFVPLYARVISGRWAVSVAPQVFQNVPGYLGSRISGRHPTGCANTAAATRFGARFKRFQMKGPPMQKPITMNLSMPR